MLGKNYSLEVWITPEMWLLLDFPWQHNSQAWTLKLFGIYLFLQSFAIFFKDICNWIVFVGNADVVCDRLALWVLWNPSLRWQLWGQQQYSDSVHFQYSTPKLNFWATIQWKLGRFWMICSYLFSFLCVWECCARSWSSIYCTYWLLCLN